MGDEKEMLKQLGKNIARLRTKKGLSQSELATAAGIEKATLGHIELGTRNPTVKTLYKIAKALGTSLNDIVKFK